MLLKVGELAAHTGLTVRTLHHYDSIGLLKPSARSEVGYRLYDRADVARLHGIQTLRHMGLTLADIARLMDDGGSPLPALIARQLAQLEQEMARSAELHRRLSSMQAVLAAGGEPEMGDWLGSLALMSTYAQYFSADELKRIFEQWKRTEAEWPPLVKALREAMARGVPHDAPRLQPLVRHWMELSARWMNGDIDLLKRWGRMLREQPDMSARSGMDRALLAYADRAVQARLEVLGRHLSPEDIRRLDKTLGLEWRSLSERAERLMRKGVPAESAAARALAREWTEMFDRMVRHDAALGARVRQAYDSEPLLQAGASVSPEARRYLQRAAGREREALDPHAT